MEICTALDEDPDFLTCRPLFSGIEEREMQKSRWPEALPRPGNNQLESVKSRSSWFEVYKVEENTFALLEPNHWEEVISYLIIGESRAVLFDSGMGIGDIKAEVAQLTTLPVIVINSHSHYDHIGGNSAFGEVWAYNNGFETNRIQSGYSLSVCRSFMQPDMYKNLPDDFDLEHYCIKPSTITHRLNNLEAIDLGNRFLIVHHTPGHTPGSICLFDLRYRLLFTGDTFYPGALLAHLEESDVRAYRDSLQNLERFSNQIHCVCPGHNVACIPKEMLARACRGFEKILVGNLSFDGRGDGARCYCFEDFDILICDE